MRAGTADYYVFFPLVTLVVAASFPFVRNVVDLSLDQPATIRPFLWRTFNSRKPRIHKIDMVVGAPSPVVPRTGTVVAVTMADKLRSRPLR